jgi:tetratricopeptide (TPR) repeat protein
MTVEQLTTWPTETDLEAAIPAALQKAFPTLSKSSIRHQTKFSFQVGRTLLEVDGTKQARTEGRADVIAYVGDRPVAVVELKRAGLALTYADGLQGLSYARMLTTQPPLVIVTNGTDTNILATYSGTDWAPAGEDERTLEGLLRSASRVAAEDMKLAISTLMGTDSRIWIQAVRQATARTLEELSGGWSEWQSPFVRDFLVPRRATDDLLRSLQKGTLVDQIERATLRAFQVPADAGAYGHYLLGQKALQALDLPGTRRARASFRAALASSPHFAPAHAGYSQTLIYEWLFRGRDDPDLVERARRAAERAREIDPLLGSAHQMLGRASLFAGDFGKSLEHLETAENLSPHYADLLCEFADTLMHSSLPERANQKIESALRLNPLAPDNYWWASAGIKFFIGEYDNALAHLSRVKNEEPVLRLTAACAAMAGRPDLARQARIRFLTSDPGFKLDEWIGALPVRDAEHRRLYRHALQKAGFK